MSPAAQLKELENQKRQLLDGTLAEIEELIDALNEAGFSYRLVSSESEAVALLVTARTGKQRKQRLVESGFMPSCPPTIINALTEVENTDDNALSLVDQVDPASALNSRMATLGDGDLWLALNYFYPRFHNLVSGVATVTGMSIGHVQRVLDGERTSAEIKAAIVKEFRRRIETKDGRGGHFDEAVQPEAGSNVKP
jgi:hypothetical protein